MKRRHVEMACGIKVNLKKQEISGPKGRAVRQAAEKLAVALSGVLRQGCRSNHLSINLRDCSSGKGKRAWRVGIYGLGKANWSGDNMDLDREAAQGTERLAETLFSSLAAAGITAHDVDMELQCGHLAEISVYQDE